VSTGGLHNIDDLPGGNIGEGHTSTGRRKADPDLGHLPARQLAGGLLAGIHFPMDLSAGKLQGACIGNTVLARLGLTD
jgi:hypothetical protein